MKKKIACLDGLRGVAALWVLIGHSMILSGWQLPVIGQPDLGVDLFIMLSGFLMIYQAQVRSEAEDWSRPTTWMAFWVRRFFRIAPLFYVLLAVALLAGPSIYADRVTIDAIVGAEPQQSGRYLDASLGNVAAYLTFLFGLLPYYCYRTPLPDWSIGLEMQFYAVFPFIFLLAKRIGWIGGSLISVAIGGAVAVALHFAHIVYPMPSMLALKLHLFFCGMLIAADYRRTPGGLATHLLLIILFAAIPLGGDKGMLHLSVRELIAVGFFALIHWQRVAVIRSVSGTLGKPFFHWLGELSFGVYLAHLLIMHRVAAWTLAQPWIQGEARFLSVIGITLPLTYGAAFITYKTI